jgi:hypothetical protein
MMGISINPSKPTLIDKLKAVLRKNEAILHNSKGALLKTTHNCFVIARSIS